MDVLKCEVYNQTKFGLVPKLPKSGAGFETFFTSHATMNGTYSCKRRGSKLGMTVSHC